MLTRSRTLLFGLAVSLGLTTVRSALAAPEPSPWRATEEDEEHDGRRFEWWHRARAYPAGKIPAGAFVRARDAWSILPRTGAAGPTRPHGLPGLPMPGDYMWRSIGPNGITTTQSLLETPNMGPEAGRASAIAVDPTNPSTLYAGYSVGGVWRSKDDGMTWVPLGDRLPSLAIGSIAVAPGNPDTIFVGTGEGALTAGYTGAGVLVTMDGGDSWTQLAASAFGGLSVPRLLIDPTSGDLYLTAIFGVAGRGEGCTNIAFDAAGQGVYRSTDLGVTWTRLYAGETSDLEIDFTSSPPHLLTVDQQTGAMYSFDGGVTWTASTGLPTPTMSFAAGIELSMSPADPTLVFAGVGMNGGDVFVSHDGGVTFTEIPGSPAYCAGQCYYDNSVLADPVDPNVVWLGGSLCGIWKTLEALAPTPFWINVSAQNDNCGVQSENWGLGFVHPDVHALAVVPGAPSHLYAATDGGIARTLDGGTTWERLNSGVSTIQFYAVCVDPNDPDAVYGGAQDNGSSMRDGTDTWRGIISGDGGYCAVNIADSDNVLVTDTAGTVVLTMDRFHGIPTYPFATNPSFCQENKPGCGDRSSFITPLVGDPNQADTFYIGTYRVYRSDDKGQNWQLISNDVTAGSGTVQCVSAEFPPEDDTITALAVAPKHSEVIFTGSAGGVISRTLDGGKSWKMVSKKPLPRRWVSDVVIDPNDPNVVYAAFSGFDSATPEEPGHVFRSTDGGEHWEQRAFPADVPVDSLVAHPVGSDLLYAGTDLGALISIDAGKSWQVLGQGLPDVPVFSLRFHQGAARLLAGTHGRSVWAVDFPGASLAASPGELSFEGTQGGPNPSGVLHVRDRDPYGSIASYEAVSSAPWLFAGPEIASVAGATPLPLGIRVDMAKAAIGDNDGVVTLIPTAGTLGARIDIPVHLKVKAETFPNNPSGPTPTTQTGCDCAAASGPGDSRSTFAGALLLGLAAAVRRRTRARAKSTRP
jgi:MYXO-CTERM domain-containing protein